MFRARCRTNGRTVAVKKIDLENAPMKLDEIVKEAQAMRNAQHDNILTLHTSFVHEKDLWMIEPFVSGGSVLHLMKVPAHEKGLDERSVSGGRAGWEGEGEGEGRLCPLHRVTRAIGS